MKVLGSLVTYPGKATCGVNALAIFLLTCAPLQLLRFSVWLRPYRGVRIPYNGRMLRQSQLKEAPGHLSTLLLPFLPHSLLHWLG